MKTKKPGKKSKNTKKKRLKIMKIPSSVANFLQKSRPGKARSRDARTTSKKVIKDSRWVYSPGNFDYPGVDTKGYGRDPEYERKLKREKENEYNRKKKHAEDRLKHNNRELRGELYDLKNAKDEKNREKLRVKIEERRLKIKKNKKSLKKIIDKRGEKTGK